MCSLDGVELPHPFVYLWEDTSPNNLARLTKFADSLLSTTFDFVLCICNTGFDSDQLSHAGEDHSAQRSALYLPFEKIGFSVADEVLCKMRTCFTRRLGLAAESTVSCSRQNAPPSTLRTFKGEYVNSIPNINHADESGQLGCTQNGP